jgi:hypothetical protein
VAEELADPPRGGVGAGEQVARQRFDLVLNPSSARSVAVTGEAADGSPAGTVREPDLGLDAWGAGEHSYHSRPVGPAPLPAPEPPAPTPATAPGRSSS